MNDIRETVKKMYEEGLKDEDLVMKITEQTFNCKTYKSSIYEDTQLHIDFWCEINDKRYGIDVKGLRKNKRSDANFDDSIQWIELKNVLGKDGWVYGKSSYITFMTKNSILYCPRKKLVTYIEEKIKDKETVHFRPNNCYIPYQRNERLDKIVKVPTNDIRKLSKHEIMINQ